MTQPVCLGVVASGRAQCFQVAENCAGAYYALGGVELLLPAGWYYPTVPSACVRMSDAEFECTLKTGTAFVSPTA